MLDWIIIFLVTILFIHWITLKPKGFPPGPPCVPVLGSLPFVRDPFFHFLMEKMREKYGPVIGLKFGPQSVIAVCGPKEVEEVLKRDEFQGRPVLPEFKSGIMFAEGSFWVEQRRFAIRHLRDFGFGKKSAENVILEEVDDFFENVFNRKSIVQVSGLFNTSAINVLWAMMGGNRFSHNDEEFRTLLNCLQERFRRGNVTTVSSVFPFLKKVFPEWSGYREEKQTDDKLREFFQVDQSKPLVYHMFVAYQSPAMCLKDKSIKEHRATRTDDPRDFIDVYLGEIDGNKKLGSSFTEETMITVFNDLFSAGAESTGNTLGFCLLYLVLYPKWQEQVFQEIASVIGTDNRASVDDRIRLPKVEAFVSEVMRSNTIATLTVPHAALQDCYLNGHFIPKRAMVLVSLWSLLQDKEHWGDPENFRPDRFLDENGEFVKDNYMFIFGLGKRICLGESLARSILFLFFVSMVQRFRFSLPPGHPKPSTICLPGFTQAAQPFEVAVTRRD